MNEELQQLQNSINFLTAQVLEIKKLRIEMQKQLEDESISGALKYMAKQLQELTKHVHQIKEEGVKKQINLDLTMDGYEMVKRKPPKINLVIEDESKKGEEITRDLLDTLSPKEGLVLIHRYALFGGKTKTYEVIGKEFKLSRERIRQIELKALRKCRHHSRKDIAENLTHLELRKAILGE